MKVFWNVGQIPTARTSISSWFRFSDGAHGGSGLKARLLLRLDRRQVCEFVPSTIMEVCLIVVNPSSRFCFFVSASSCLASASGSKMVLSTFFCMKTAVHGSLHASSEVVSEHILYLCPLSQRRSAYVRRSGILAFGLWLALTTVRLEQGKTLKHFVIFVNQLSES